MLKYCRNLNYINGFFRNKILIGVLAHVPVVMFIANFIKGKFGIKIEEKKRNFS